MLSDNITESVIEAVNQNANFFELYFHWNRLTAVFGQAFFEELKGNQNLRVLDLSWNSLG